MTRIQQSKAFLGVLAVLLVAFIGANFFFLGPVKGLASLLAIELFVIWHNRKQKEGLKTFNVGKKLHKKGRYEEAITMFLTFIKEVKENPEKEKTTILQFGLYTNSAVAMAYNNIGAGCIELGYFNKAIESLERSVEVDADYAIPYYNLAVIATLRKEDDKVNRYIEKMHALGYKISMEEVIQKSESLPEEIVEVVAETPEVVEEIEATLETEELTVMDEEVIKEEDIAEKNTD